MRNIPIALQYYLDYGYVNSLSYDILPFDETILMFPIHYILLLDDVIVVDSVTYFTEDELSDWSVYQIMDDKIKAKLGLS